MANFVDTSIDYPNSKMYVEQLLVCMESTVELFTSEKAKIYRLHIKNMQAQS